MRHTSRRGAAVAVLTAAALVASSSGAWAADVDGQLVRAVKTSAWPIPSPDPSGIAVAANGNLTISDGEVEEINLYEGANIFHTTRSGEQVGTTTTVPWSDEPTGIAYHPNGTVYISDDDEDAIFIADSLGDTSPARFSTRPWIPDPEGVAYDTLRGELLIANGEGGPGFARVNPGPDRTFGTGDDTHTAKIDLSGYGAVDTEGIAYDGVRDTVVVVDDNSQKIYELSANGTLMNTIDISGMGVTTAAGVEVAQASDGSNARHYYVVDRGRDPGTNPDSTVNDGVMHEIRAVDLPSAGPGVNQPPTANAGPDKVVTLPGPVTLNGSGVDTVTPAAELGFAWSRVSGPGTVTFGSANAATTTVTFTAAGQHQFRLTVTDGGGATGTDTVNVTVAEAGGDATVEIAIAASTDDAREGNPTTPTYVDTGTKTNDLGTGATGAGVTYPSKVGLRFTNVPVPKGAEILSARIQFMADQPSTGDSSLTIAGEAADNARTFANTNGSRVSDRVPTSARATWSVPAWLTTNDRGPAQLTPDLKALLQEIVNRPNWVQGNAAAFMIEGTGRRIARSFEAASATGATAKAAPSLLLQFKASPPPGNTAPVVNAGADTTVKLPAGATLNGTVTDDGQPTPAKVTSTWSKVSGPGTVTFADATKSATTATFSAAGVYTLRLTASDGTLSAQDDVVITVLPADTAPPPPPPPGPGPANAAPTVNAGADATVKLPAGATLNGTVTDDGQPTPAKVTSTWSKVSGPGTVTFGNAALVDTTASFSQAGVYTLRLRASDGALSGQDDVVITVQAAAPASAQVSLDANKGGVLSGGQVRLSGVLRGAAAGTSVELSVRRGPRGALVPLATVVTDAGGAFTYVDRPTVNSRYVAKSGEVSSGVVRVTVHPRVTSRVTKPSVLVGTRTAIVGRVSPALAGQRLRLQQWTGARWRVVGSTTVAAGDRVRYRFVVVPSQSGITRFRVVVPAMGGRARTVATGPATGHAVEAYDAAVVRVAPRRGMVVIANTGSVTLSLAGWSLVERRTGARVTLPEFTLRPGRLVRIHSGKGQDRPRRLFLGVGDMWSDRGGVLVLRDSRNRVVHRVRY